MSDADWPAPEAQSAQGRRLPLPRVEDLPVAEQGYDREAVSAAFDAFYRHAARLDATLRTLEAVDAFQRTASELRAEIRTIRAAGWTVSPYGRGGYGRPGQRVETLRGWALPPAAPRMAAEAIFLVVIGVIVGVSGWQPIAIVLTMALAWAIVVLVELASRERPVPRATTAPAQPPRLDDEPAELPAGTAAAAVVEEGPEAMTMLGTEPARGHEAEHEDTQGDAPSAPEPEAADEPEASEQLAEQVEEPAAVEDPAAVEEPDEAEEPAAIGEPDEAEEPEEPAPPAPAAEAAPAEAAAAAPDDEEGGPETGAHAIAAVAAELEDHPTDDGAEGGVEGLASDVAERRFRLWRRAAEPPAEAPGPEPAELDVAPEPAGDEFAVEAVDDPWERGPDVPDVPDPVDDTPELPADAPAARRSWFRRRGDGAAPEPSPPAEPLAAETEQEAVEQLLPEPADDDPLAVEAALEPEPEPLPATELDAEPEPQPEPLGPLPVDVLADQAAAALDRSRARRRAPRRARRR